MLECKKCEPLLFSLGVAYAGSDREDVISVLLPVLADPKSSMEVRSMCRKQVCSRTTSPCECLTRTSICDQVVGIAALACGQVAVGSCNGEVTSTILQTLMEKSETELKDTYARFLALGLGLTYLGEYFPPLSVPLQFGKFFLVVLQEA